MTATNDTAGAGEQRLKSRRRAFWRCCAIGMIGGLIAGFASGFTIDLVGEGRLPALAIIALLAAALAGFIWFSVDYFRRVDELDLADNLWSCLFGLYFYVCLFPGWHILNDAGLVGEPDQWAIFIATMAFTAIVYGVRKLGWR